MAEINEVVSKEAIQSIKDADAAIVLFDGNIDKLIQSLKGLTGGGTGLKDLNKTIQDSTKAAKDYNEVQKQAAKVTSDLQKAGAARAAAMDKEIAKEEELAKALKGELGAYKQLTTQVSQAKKAYLEIAAAQGMSSKAAKDAKLTHDKLNKTLTDLNRSAAIYSPEVGKYGMMWDKVKGLAMGAVGALGITAGLAGAMKLVGGVIQSTDKLADEFEKTMSGLKESVQFAARAFANFDFTNFLSGLAEANKEGRRYAETLDLIGDLNRANQLQQNDIERQILEQRIIAKNKGNELSVREAAIKEIIRLEELKLSQTQIITKKGINNELQNSAFRTKAQEKDVLDLVKNYDKKVDAIANGNKLIQQIEAQTRSTTVTPYGETIQIDTKAREQAFARLTESQKESVKWARIDAQLTEEKRQALVGAIDADQKATNEMLSGREGLIRLENSLRSELIKTEKAEANGIKTKEKESAATKQLGILISANTEMEYNATQQKILENEARKIATQLIEDEANALLELSDAQAAAGVEKSQGAKTKAALKSLPGLTLGQSFNALSSDDKKQLAIDAAQQTTDATFSIIANAANAEFDLKMSNLEKEKDEKLKNTKLTEAAKAKIEEDYKKKSDKLKTEAAKKQKSADIIQAIINTALAVSKALPNIPLSIAAGIAGAAQIAVIAAQPIPKFDTGTTNSPNTFWAGEQRPEFLKKPGGNFQLITQPTLLTNSAHSTVISGEETDRIMKLAGKDGLNGLMFMPDIKGMTNEIVQAIKGKSEIHISGTTGKITERTGNYSKEYFNRKVSWQRNQN